MKDRNIDLHDQRDGGGECGGRDEQNPPPPPPTDKGIEIELHPADHILPKIQFTDVLAVIETWHGVSST